MALHTKTTNHDIYTVIAITSLTLKVALGNPMWKDPSWCVQEHVLSVQERVMFILNMNRCSHM